MNKSCLPQVPLIMVFHYSNSDFNLERTLIYHAFSCTLSILYATKYRPSLFMVIAVILFTVTRIRNQPKCPSTDGEGTMKICTCIQ